MMRLNLVLAGVVILALPACSEAATLAPEPEIVASEDEIAVAEINTTESVTDQPASITLPDGSTHIMAPGERIKIVLPPKDTPTEPINPIRFPELISAPEAHELSSMGQIRLIDIRTPREWRNTGVPEGAATINMRKNDFIDRVLAEVSGDKSAPIALTCATGGRSSTSARKLRDAGFTNVSDVSEGFFGNRNAGPGWQAHGLPIDAYVEEAD